MQIHYDHCAVLVRESDRDRYLSTLFAPARYRDALYALYAFNVEISRVRDLAREPMPGEVRLQWWREVLSGARAGEGAAHPVAAALLATLAQHKFVVKPLLELIEAHSFDLYNEPMATVDDLELYAIQTQSPLFAMAAGILAPEKTPDLFTLGAAIAYAIGQILSGFAKHASRRQLFVPLDILDRHRIKPEDIFSAQVSEPLLTALAEMRGVAREHLIATQAKLLSAPQEILPAFLPVALVGPQLRRMDSAAYQPFAFQQTAPWRRQWLLWRAARNPDRIFTA